MTPEEAQEQLVVGIAATAEAMGTPLSEATLVVMAGDLVEFPLGDVMEALRRTRREHPGRLTIAAVFERLRNAPRVMTADEAWSLCLRKEPWNEERTCILPRAALVAWYAAADAYRDGDKIGARMAFKGAWPAAVAEHGREIAISEGWDREDRDRAIEQAVAEGMIAADTARAHGVLIEGPIGRQGDAPAQIEGPENGEAGVAELTRNIISDFADHLRDQSAAKKATEERVDLAEAMVRHGRAPDFEAGLEQIGSMTDEEKAALVISIQNAELAEMGKLREAQSDVSA